MRNVASGEVQPEPNPHCHSQVSGSCANSLVRLVNVLGSNQWSEDVVPTVAFNLRQVRKGNVTMKVWDVAVSREWESGVGSRRRRAAFARVWCAWGALVLACALRGWTHGMYELG
jgi:hypothetical protein